MSKNDFLPEDITNEIAGKRDLNNSENPSKDENESKEQDPKESDKKDEKETGKDDDSNKDDSKQKKGQARQPKNGQSIAQIADDAADEDDEDDDDEDDDDENESGSKKRNNNRLVRRFMDTKRELKEMKRSNQERDELIKELVEVVKDLKTGGATAKETRDEIEEFAEEWGMNKDGAKALVKLIENRLSGSKGKKSTKLDLDDEDDFDDDEEETPKKSKKKDKKQSKGNDAAYIRKVELAIEGEYDDFTDSYPGIDKKINLKAIKRYILGDNENLSKSFHDIVDEMYPGVLERHAGVDGAGGNGSTNEGEKKDFTKPEVQAKIGKDKKTTEEYADDLINRVQGMYQ